MTATSNANGDTSNKNGGVAKQAKEIAADTAAKAKDLVSTRVAEQTGKSAGEIGRVAEALHDTSKQLEGNVASPYVEKAALQLERASTYLRTTNIPDLARAVDGFARREPLLFLGGAFLVGLAGARFLKASAHHGEADTGEMDRTTPLMGMTSSEMPGSSTAMSTSMTSSSTYTPPKPAPYTPASTSSSMSTPSSSTSSTSSTSSIGDTNKPGGSGYGGSYGGGGYGGST